MEEKTFKCTDCYYYNLCPNKGPNICESWHYSPDMKKIILFVLLVIVLLSACNNIDKESFSEVSKVYEDKYGQPDTIVTDNEHSEVGYTAVFWGYESKRIIISFVRNTVVNGNEWIADVKNY